jgi:hypothetical protein
MKIEKVMLVASLEAILVGVLIGGVMGCSLARRSRFWLRLAALATAIVLPGLIAIVAPLGERGRGMIFWLGLLWGLLCVAGSRFVLFHGSGLDPGGDESDGEGPGPGDDRRPTPPAPIGGVPLPDAEPSSTRLRNHRPTQRPSRERRRPVPERERAPSRLWPLRLWPFWHPS